MRHAIPGLILLLVLCGCGHDTSAPSAGAAPSPESKAAEEITRTSTSGPVKATVTLSPAKPILGDALTLTLEVVAEPGVEVRMPAFGEALGRFDITGFVPRSRTLLDGRTQASQKYSLESPMSGPQTIPPLRVEFVDRRGLRLPGAVTEPFHELMTEKISVDVASVLPEGRIADALKPLRGSLEELPPPAPSPWPWIAALSVLLAVLVPFALRGYRRWDRQRRRRSAYDVALARLMALEMRSAPGAGEVDSWYVELSSIVRRYLEDRYGLRAPERTTEEFLREAGGSSDLAADHRSRLRTFLQQCDRVKFAAYRPGTAEAWDSLKSARQFLDETREGAPMMEADRAAAS